MSTSEETAIIYHGSSFVEVSHGASTIFIDPTFSSSRRGRRSRGTTRPCDYVLVSQEGDHLDDAIDVLEDSKDAVLVSSDRVCKIADDELDLERGRALDLEPWERAKEDAFRVTAVPIFTPSLMDDGAAALEDLVTSAGLPRTLQELPFAREAMRSARSLGALPSLLGGPLARAMRGRGGLGWLFELKAGQRVLSLGAGVHSGTDERELEDIASLSEVDALILDVATVGVEPVVRAARIFEPTVVLLYRSQDPYARGRRSSAVPMSAFVEAIGEDRGDRVEALHLRSGDRFVLTAPAKKPAAEAAKKPAAPASAKPS